MSISAEHILLTHIPPFLRHPRNLREFFLHTTGQTKHISYSCPIKRSPGDEEGDDNLDVAALVKLTNSAQSMTFIRNWINARKTLSSTMNAFIWYEDGSMPQLYPERSEVDRRMLESLWDTIYSKRKDDDVGRTAQSADDSMVNRLIMSYQHLKSTQEQLDRGESPQTKLYDELKSENKLDKDKVAAAAGGYGAYDEETDPLNAPEVLAAVAEFRKKVDESTGGYKRKRAEYVKKRLDELKQVAKERIKETSKNAPLPPTLPPLPTALPPPPPIPPPLPPGLVPPIGVSAVGAPGLPPVLPPPPPVLVPPPIVPLPSALSTNISATVDEEPVSKRAKYDEGSERKERIDIGSTQSLAEIKAANQAEDNAAYLKEASQYTKEQILSNAKFPFIHEKDAASIRVFVKEQLVEYLGEEEATLIDFIMNYIKDNNKERGTTGLLEELEMVLEEDAKTFVVDLFRKIIEIISH
jgi:hypothetical protein